MENEFVESLFNKYLIKFEKTQDGEYNIDGNFHLKHFPELIANGKLTLKLAITKDDCHSCLASQPSIPASLKSFD